MFLKSTHKSSSRIFTKNHFLLLNSLDSHLYLHSKTSNTRIPYSLTHSTQLHLHGICSSEATLRAIHPKIQSGYLKKCENEDLEGNKLTYPFVLKACSGAEAFEEGRQVHGEIVKHGLDDDVYVSNNLVHFYGCCKKIMDAKKWFDEMRERTVVSWNTVITACVENFCFEDGLGYFVKMRDCGFDTDETMMVVVLSACAELGFLRLGRLFHLQVIHRGFVSIFQVGTALVDMYGKSGDVRYANRVFERMKEKNVWTWSAMILGFAQHGFAKEALQLFTEMKRSSCIRPNYVTFLGVLCDCSHAGLVDDGFRYFHEMENVHGIKPMMIHYGAMVDILGRAGRLKEACTFINNMPIEQDPVLWRTLLSACNVHSVNGTDEVGDKVRKKLPELESRRTGNLVMVANMYAESVMWDWAANVRKFMRYGGLKKMAGESWLEINGSVYPFYSGYDSLFHLNDVYPLLDTLILHMKMISVS